MKNIGFIGVGNIASTIISGLATSKLDIKLFGYNHGHVNDHVALFQKEKVMEFTDDINELVKESDYIIMAVPPQLIQTIASQIKPSLINDKKVFMSVAAGVTLEDYEKEFGSKVKLIRVMPNVNAAVKESMTALCANKNVSDDEKNFGKQLFDQVGETIWLGEKLFNIFMPIAGSFPAMVFMMIDALNKVAIEYGMNKELATKVAIQTIAGSTKYAKDEGLNKNIDMSSLVSRVASPGGTTINGVDKLNKANFDSLIEEVIIAMMKAKN